MIPQSSPAISAYHNQTRTTMAGVVHPFAGNRSTARLMGAASIAAAPLPLVWFLLTGIVILRAERCAETQTTTL